MPGCLVVDGRLSWWTAGHERPETATCNYVKLPLAAAARPNSKANASPWPLDLTAQTFLIEWPAAKRLRARIE
jgi:hypothetical protein